MSPLPDLRDLITGHSVDPSNPVLFARRSLVSLQVGEQLNYQLSRDRWCVGYDEPNGGIGPCPDQNLAMENDQCLKCSNRTRLKDCLRCTGASCRNLARRSDCVFSDHLVYLACYELPRFDGHGHRLNRPFKVGVTRRERFEQRIVEQGAWGAIGIAAAGGQEVRNIEYQIFKAGWPDRMNILPMLTQQPIPAATAERLLREEVVRIAEQLRHIHLVSDGPFTYAGDHFPEPMTIPPRTLDPKHDALAGTVVGLRGGYLFLDCAGETVAVALRSLSGRELLPRSEEITGPAQISLAF